MKKILFSIALLGCNLTLLAQEITPANAMQYAMDNLTGTARYRAMSGAFGALGGDLSALNSNPAGSAVFRFNQASGTLSSINTRNSSSYFGTRTIENEYALDLNQAGVVFVFANQNPDSDWKKFSLAINYENNSNFENQIFTRGVNPSQSIDRYFLRFANGLPNEGGIFLDVLNNAFFEDLNFIDQQALLGYNAYIFNPVENVPDNSLYVSNVPTLGNYYQENFTSINGYNGKLTGNFATSYQDKLYLGINLNAHFTDATTVSSIYERYNASQGLQSVQFDNETYTYGGGFSFALGAIAKISESLRLGLTYESPTWYTLHDEQRQRIRTFCNTCASNNPIIYDPNVTMIYDSYRLQTPGKWSASGAYVFGKRGLISVDYSMKDYSTTTYRPRTDSYLESLNDYMKTNLTVSNELRIGGEFKHKQWSLRGGYRMEESPYKERKIIGDLQGYTGGLGYDFGDSRIDLAYAYSSRKMDFNLISSGMTDTSRLTTINNNISVTYSINF
ncbi:OmpP1/FadL family transporter [Flavobacterium sp.]|uniref:OmpP1/FadL family transporter n=1 Tax=Flavobacterium sp. TaxID=239 RepID=UPI002FD981CE